MAYHTNWDKWMFENLRYAISYNNVSIPLQYTYSEYYVQNYNNQGWGSIDIVGKSNPKDNFDKSVVIEVKGSLSDINSGKGQNFVGKYNFLATDRKFLDKLIYFYNEHYCNTGIGILVVESDGAVKTILPAIAGSEKYSIASNFDEFATDDDVEDFFANIEIPKQKRMDANKPYKIFSGVY